MSTFDQILPQLTEALAAHATGLAAIGELVINRDLNGRVRLIVAESVREHAGSLAAVQAIAEELFERLGKHAYPADRAVLFEEDPAAVCTGAPSFALAGHANVRIVDRLATEVDWTSIAPESTRAPRIVFSPSKAAWVALLRWRHPVGLWLSLDNVYLCSIWT